MRIKLNESQIERIVAKNVKKILKEGESYGWIVEPSEARDAYNFFCEQIGTEEANEEIVNTLSTDELSDSLAFLFRMYDMKEWYDRKK